MTSAPRGPAGAPPPLPGLQPRRGRAAAPGGAGRGAAAGCSGLHMEGGWGGRCWAPGARSVPGPAPAPPAAGPGEGEGRVRGAAGIWCWVKELQADNGCGKARAAPHSGCEGGREGWRDGGREEGTAWE